MEKYCEPDPHEFLLESEKALYWNLSVEQIAGLSTPERETNK